MSAPLSFFPLGPARTVPVATVRPKAGPSKRSRPPSAQSSPVKKRAVSDKPLPLVLGPVTPQPSSDGPHVQFKVPALPAHLAPLTPTTSTVAASSSPRRLALSSSPARNTSALSSTSAPSRSSPVRLEGGTTLIFGRHHVRGSRSEAGPVPASLAQHLQFATHPARTVILDRAAKHASRVHAAAELLPPSATSPSLIRLVVLGQNGLRVRAPGAKFKRLTPGTVRTFPADVLLEVDFYGAGVMLRAFEDPDETDDECLFTPEPEPQTAPSPMSLPPSSPPQGPMSMDAESDEEEMRVPASDEAAPTPFAVRVAPPITQDERSSSPLSELDEPACPSVPSAPSAEALAVKQELLDAAASVVHTPSVSTPNAAAPPPSRAKTPKSRAASPAPVLPIPDELDLPALLASTVVFSGSSKLSLPDLVKSLLEAQPSMRVHGDESVWAAWAGAALESNDMFGKITRNGRDASGRPLQPHYFYNPAADPDAARARELGGLVRPLRATQRGGGRAIDWRPVGPGRRRY